MVSLSFTASHSMTWHTRYNQRMSPVPDIRFLSLPQTNTYENARMVGEFKKIIFGLRWECSYLVEDMKMENVIFTIDI